jgi:hypothetical protein
VNNARVWDLVYARVKIPIDRQLGLQAPFRFDGRSYRLLWQPINERLGREVYEQILSQAEEDHDER